LKKDDDDEEIKYATFNQHSYSKLLAPQKKKVERS
jgi:hypothetical protein